MTTPRGAAELVEGQAVPETTVNEQIRHTEAGACFFPVVDKDLTAPPGSCSDGASYIVGPSATGLWASKDDQIATAVGTNAANGWLYHAELEGLFAYVQDENLLYQNSGSAWGVFPTGGAEASNAEIYAGDETSKFISPRRLYTAGEPVILTDGATITPDLDAGINFDVTLGGNRILANPTNQKAGQGGLIYVEQDGTGSRTLTFGSDWKFAGGDPTMSTAAGAVDVISYHVRASGFIAANISKALA